MPVRPSNRPSFAPTRGTRRASERTERLGLHDLAGGLLGTVHRLVRLLQMHAPNNAAVTQAVDASAASVRSLTDALSGSATLSFVGETVFVEGQLLRASRAEYEAASELASLLARCGASELTFTPAVTSADMLELVTSLIAALHNPNADEQPLATETGHISAREAEPLTGISEGDAGDPPGRMLTTYASAVAVMRRYFEEISGDSITLPHRVKRVAQRLASLATNREAPALSLMTFAPSDRDVAGFSVLSALLAVTMAREVTQDPVASSRLALTALLCDVGRVRSSRSMSRIRRDDDEFEDAVPAVAAALCLAGGGRSEAALARASVVYAVNALETGSGATPDARDRGDLLSAGVIFAARAFLEAVAPPSGVPGVSPAEAIAAVASLPNADPTALGLMTTALGPMPPGTVVELDTGQWAVVAGTSKAEGAEDRPCIRIVTDARGHALESPTRCDLGDSSSGVPRIARIVPPAMARFNTSRALLW